MTTELKRIANRENGAKSHGPVTPEGKAVSKLNAMKHGLYSEVTLIDGENAADLVAFGRRLRADLAPVGELELMLADKIVSTAWRLRRLVGVEAEMYDAETTNKFTFDNGGDGILRLSRHEAGLERALYRALHELQRLQAARKGAIVPPPTAVDITVSTDNDTREKAPHELGSFRQTLKLEHDRDDHEQSP